MPYRMLLFPLFAWVLATTGLAQTETQPSTLAPSDKALVAPSEPAAVFERLHDYLHSSPLEFQTSFQARSDTLAEDLQHGSAHYLIRSPNLFRIEGSIGHYSYELISDGNVLTIYDRGGRKFAQLPAPSSAAAAVSLFAGLNALDPQVLKFLSAVDLVVAGKEGVQVAAVGSGTVGGQQCDRFDVVQQVEDSWEDKWEVWLQKKQVPLMCKLVSSSSDDTANTVQTNEFTWKPSPVFSPETFVFSPPEGSKKVDVGELGLGAPQ
jgi:hypothetical protein